MNVGVIVRDSVNPEETIRHATELGFFNGQLSGSQGELQTREHAEELCRICEKYHFEISAVIASWSGPHTWNFYDGPLTLGLLPEAYRFQRIQEIQRAIDYAEMLGVSDVNTHIGFIPEDPNCTAYREMVAAVKFICQYAAAKNIHFCLETGQETPIAMLRLILDTGAENIGVNFDPANLLMYGKANPVDALDILGKYIRGVHGKDGDYPTTPFELGEEKAIGQGRVDFERFIPALKKTGYDGPVTIEREISGPQQEKDILLARDVLQKLIAAPV